MKPSAWFRIIVAITVAVGLALIYFHDCIRRPYDEFALALGHAALIAGILAATVDRYVKQRLALEVASDVAAAVAGSELPVEIRHDIKASFDPDRLVFKKYRQHYKVELTSEGSSVTVGIQYSVCNYSGRPQTYVPTLGLEERDKPRFLHVSAGGVNRSGEELELTAKRKEPPVPVGLGNKWATGPTLRLAGMRAGEPPDSKLVVWKYVLTLPREGTDLISFGRTTIGVSISGDVPDGFEFWVTAAGEKDGERTPPAAKDTWEYERLFRPSTHIRVRWYETSRPLQPRGTRGRSA